MGEGGVVEREADLFGRGPVCRVRELGEDAGIGFKLRSVGGALVDEEVFEAGGAVRRGGFVVDDPEDVFAGSVRREAGAKDAVDTDRDGADGGGPGYGWRGLLGGGGWRGPGGEGELAGGAGVGREQPEAIGIAQSIFQGSACLAGKAVDGGGGKAVGAQQSGDAREPGGEFGEEFVWRLARGDARGQGFEGRVDDVAEGAGGKRAFRAGELGRAGDGGAVGIAVGQFVGTSGGDARGGVEGEREALQVGVGWGRGGDQVEFVAGIGDAKICGTNPGLRIET